MQRTKEDVMYKTLNGHEIRVLTDIDITICPVSQRRHAADSVVKKTPELYEFAGR